MFYILGDHAEAFGLGDIDDPPDRQCRWSAMSWRLLLLAYFPILLVKHNYCSIPITVKWQSQKYFVTSSFNWNRDPTIISTDVLTSKIRKGKKKQVYQKKLVKSENKKKTIRSGLTFFGVSSCNFFNNGFPHKFWWFLGSVSLALCNDTTFVEKTLVSLYLLITPIDIKFNVKI